MIHKSINGKLINHDGLSAQSLDTSSAMLALLPSLAYHM